MGTQVHCEGYLPACYSMSDLNEESNNSSWPLFYGDKSITSKLYCNGYTSRSNNAYSGCDKDALKQKMLEHEAIFKNQVLELHRLYRIQREMMDEIKRKEFHKLRTSMEPSSSSNLLGSQVPPEDAWKRHISNITGFPLANSGYARPSTSGAEIVNSLFSSKGNVVQSGRVKMQHGCSSKISEVLEARPSKVRKKLFDLQLPADEYIDTDEDEDEQLRDIGGSCCPSSCANGSYTIAQQSTTQLFVGGGAGAISYCRQDASTSNSCLRSSIGLADLNEPAQLDEATPSAVDFLGYGNNNNNGRALNASAKSNPASVSLPGETTWKSHHASPNGSLSSAYVDRKGKEREWFSCAYETGNVRGSLAPVPQSLEHDMLPTPSHLAQVTLDKAYQPPGIHSSHHLRDELWKERTVHSLDTFNRNREKSNYTYGKRFVNSQMSSPYPAANSFEYANSWSNSISSCAKPNGFAMRLSSMHTNPSLNSSAIVSKSSQSPQSHDNFGDKWHINGSSRLNPGLASDLPLRNGLYHGSSSGSKESPTRFPVAFDSLKHTKGDNLTSDHFFNSGCVEFLTSSKTKDSVSEKGFNLNELSLEEELSRRDVDLVDAKREPQDCVPVLPWLKAKPSGRKESTDTMRGGYSVDHNMRATNELGETRSIRKILGVPILENPPASKNESPPFVSNSATLRSSPEGENIRAEGRNMVIDINMAYELSMVEPEKHAAMEPVVTEKAMETKATSVRNSFDLNSCITEDEDPFSVESNNVNLRTVVEIDLEAPVVLDTEQDNLPGEENKKHEASLQLPEHKPEKTQDEDDRIAAEAIVAISSSSQCICIEETSSNLTDDPMESLHWFVDVVFSCADELESKSSKQITCKNEIDYFEAMTLQLEETKEEDYMPKPFVPEVQTVEDSGATSLKNRRKGHGRWGRQRRDFQRDILPGLASLSRHEVTEDLQTFGGLMRATGHSWNSGLTRRNGTRNGGTRGRRRTVIETTPINPPTMHQLSNIASSLEDKSLTGWGKTTRRPRRQRCPAGNPSTPAVMLT